MAYKQLKLWFDEELARMLADKIAPIYPDFKSGHFIESIRGGVGSLELKDRVAFIARELLEQFDNDYELGISVLLQILGPENIEETGMFSNFYWVMPIAKFVEDYGLDHFDTSMLALEEITKRNSSEYAIRPYIVQYPKATLDQMNKWTLSKNFHVRRLASEGGRPRLPWATKLDQFIEDPRPLVPILDQLKDDSSNYVQKSVANCLNDIFKDNFEIGRDLVNSWLSEPTTQRKWVMKHSLRSLRKSENRWALQLSNEL